MIFRVEAKDPRIINIFTAPKEDLEPLKERVRRSGSVKIMIHPFLQENSQDSVEYPRIPGYQETRDTIIQANFEEPLVIFEEARLVRNLLKRIRETTEPAPEQIYTCTTEYNRANPQKPGLFHSLRRETTSWFDQSQRQEAWDQLARIFDWLGVENVALGGQYLTYIDVNAYHENSKTGRLLKEALEELAQSGRGRLDIPDATDANTLLPSTCVGTTALNLALRGFNVSLNLPSSPKKIIQLYEGS